MGAIIKGVSTRTVLLACVVMLQSLYAVQRPYQAGTIVDVQQKSRTRILYYLANTPVTKDDPYFEISVQLKDAIYVGEYAPLHSADTLPAVWRPGASVEVRLDKKRLYLKRPDGGELEFAIVKRMAPEPVHWDSEPVSARH